MSNNKKLGVLLMNLGSPDSTEVKDVRRYLMEFLMDGRVIDYPLVFRSLLVGGIIVPFRAPKSAEAYRSVWTKDGSPLIVISKEQQKLVEQQLDIPVEISMRYGHPSTKEAFQKLMSRQPGLEEVIAIPLYPHYAMSSYETAVEHAKKIHQRNKYPFSLKFIKPFYNDERYIQAMADSVRPYLQNKYDHVLFSYHGIPERHILKGDITGTHCLKTLGCCTDVSSPAHSRCYRHQIIVTTKLVAKALHIPENAYSFSFQSRLGRAEWLKPYTAKRLGELPAEGIKNLVLVSPAFVSDCLETMEEMDVEGKHIFMSAGGESFTRVPCMNTQSSWIDTMADWVREYQDGKTEMLLK
jgi:protoporphyrin/coproporphyrin ferrochelatase